MTSLKSFTLSSSSTAIAPYPASSSTIPSYDEGLLTMPKYYPPEHYCGLSCLSVGAGSGGSVNMLGRVSIVDYWGNELLETFVYPTEAVVDYRTAQTKLTEAKLSGGLSFDVVRAKVIELLHGRIVVGHSLWNDLAVLGISHRAVDTRDVALYLPFWATLNQQSTPRLPTLVWTFMKRHVECFSMDSTENARACMDLFRSVEYEWEHGIFNKNWPCALPPVAYARYYD